MQMIWDIQLHQMASGWRVTITGEGRKVTHQPEVCETCKGRRFYTKHFPGNESSPAWDADDQPCPDCNPNGEGVAP